MPTQPPGLRLETRHIFPGIFLWRFPLGRFFLVDHTGTHRINPTAA